MTSKPTRRKDVLDSIINLKKRQREINGLNRQNFSGLGSSAFGSVSGTASSGSSGTVDSGGNDNDYKIKSSGDTMIGPLAFYHRSVLPVSGELDVSDATGSYSSRVIVTGETGNADNVVRISGAEWAGQLLFLQPTSSTPITLKHYTDEGSVKGNIFIPSNTDYVVTGEEIVILQWDTMNFNPAHSSSTEHGQWTLISSSGSSGTWVGTAASNLNMANYNITGINQLAFTETGQTITDDTNGMRFSLPDAADTYDFTIDSNLNLSIQKYFIDFKNSRIQMTEEVAPSAPASTKNYLYVDSTSHHLTIRHPTGSAVDLETSSGGFPSPVTTDLDMNDNDILGVNLLDFDGTSTEIRGLTNLNFYHTDRQILSTGSYAGLSHTVASSEKHGFLIGGSTKMEVSSDLEMSIDIDMNDNDVLGVDQLSFSVSGQYMTGNSSGVNYYVPTGDSHKLYVGTTKIADIGAGSWDSTVALYMGNNKIRNLDEPTSNDDAATKYYVDQNSGGGSSGANTSLSNLTSTGEAHFVKLGNTSNWTAEQQFNQGIDLGSESVNGVHDYNFGAGGGKLNFNSYGYISASGSNKIYVGSAGATFKDSALFEHSVQMNSDIDMQGGDVEFSSGGRIDLESTGGSPGSFGGYVAIKIGGSTKYLMYYQ
jgi:hypothetical protein